MTWGNRGPGSPANRRRWASRPASEGLEDRKLLTAFDLTTTQTAPLGVETIGAVNNSTAGYTVTDVGNINGTGYDSFIVSAPGLSSTAVGGNPIFGANESAAYLVFGSRQVNSSTVSNFLNLTPGTSTNTNGVLTAGQRASDLAQLGTLGTDQLGQLNPTVQQPTDGTITRGFNYDGLTLVTGLDTATGLGRNSALGYSVSALGDINNDGFDDFAISAPNDAGGGKVFVVYGGAALLAQSTTTKTIDLEPVAGTTTTTAPTKVVSFSIPNAATGTNVGYSVAGIGNYFNTSIGRDLAIGAPGVNTNTGAVYAVVGTFVNSQANGTNVDLTTIGVNNSPGGIIYTGIAQGDLVGSSVATAGDFDGATGTIGTRDSLLIGASGTSGGGGTVYLVYSLQSTIANSTLGTTQSLSTLGVAPTTNPLTTPLEGVVYSDTTAGDRFGFAIATAGDFNADGAGDIIVGAPGFFTSTGAAMIINGVVGSATGTTLRTNGIFITSPGSPATGQTSLVGENFGNFAGYSVAPSAHIVFDSTETNAPGFDVLIGAPGARINGAAYQIPGNAALSGVQQLSSISNTPLNGNLFAPSGTSDPTVVPRGFGTSVSARNPVINPNTGSTTLDSDNIPDLFFGAPFSNLLNPTNLSTLRTFNGLAYAIEGSLIGGVGTSNNNNNNNGNNSGTSTTPFFISANLLLQPPIFTGETAGLPYPPVTALEKLSSYAPLPVQIAYQQYLPQPGFRARQEIALHPKKGDGAVQAPRGTYLFVTALGQRSLNKFARVNTLPNRVFDRGQFKQGQTITFTHKVKVIPRSAQKQKFTSA